MNYKISVLFSDQVVRIVNDAVLKRFLLSGKRKAAFALAASIKKKYREKTGTDLKISVSSLACEVYWHFVLKEKALLFERTFRQIRLTRWLLRHMDVIDCGEFAKDNNRFLWDALSILFRTRKKIKSD